MPRSLKKGPHVDHHLAQKVDVAKKIMRRGLLRLGPEDLWFLLLWWA